MNVLARAAGAVSVEGGRKNGLRAALEQRAARWKADLRAEPKVARLLLRRLVGPMTLWGEAEGGLRWDAEQTAADSLLDGLVQLGTSPTGISSFNVTGLILRRVA